MNIASGKKVLKPGVLLYRKIRYRKGHGVHSPFVFNFITKVIDERAPYYCLNDIELTRRKIFYEEKKDTLPLRELIQQSVISSRCGALLMRITNYFKPHTVFQIGSVTGFASLYLSSYSSNVETFVLEEIPERVSANRLVFDKHKAKNIQLIEDNCRDNLAQMLKNKENPDLIYFDFLNDTDLNRYAFETCLPYCGETTVLIIAGIKANKEMEKFWEELLSHPQVGVTIDVFEFGIVFFNLKLHKKNYIVSF
ncbi:SAM-dependent methyltransferase [Massilibacteroides sp.]|uniref:SAM-dependent methyltransferase n=1 Tax=Massilibacteroides sp. TaxID=2034766 RepID=UPI0026077253|nr:SAM-dependent methyltransferase [Massilibacteroides sp.]MDD4514413.1 SAM-dependent methyltransferase [Massilibacteroides sp.]